MKRIALGLLVALAVVSMGWAGNKLADRVASNSATLDQVIAVQVRACYREAEFRQQERIRAIVLKKLVGLFVVLSKKSVKQGPGTQQTAKQVASAVRFLREFGSLARRIHILPVPVCSKVAADLRAHLP